MTNNIITNVVSIPREGSKSLDQLSPHEIFQDLTIMLSEIATPDLLVAGTTDEPIDESHDIAFVERSGLVLWSFSLCFYACLNINIVYYAPRKFCAEAQLQFLGVKLPIADACVTQSGNGNFTLRGDDKIRIAGRTVAKAQYTVTLKVNYNTGDVRIVDYYIKVCGTNGSSLRCKEWRP